MKQYQEWVICLLISHWTLTCVMEKSHYASVKVFVKVDTWIVQMVIQSFGAVVLTVLVEKIELMDRVNVRVLKLQMYASKISNKA